jgi:cold shock CspA family protein
MPSGTVKFFEPDGYWGFESCGDMQPKVFLRQPEVQKAGFAEIEKGQRWQDVISSLAFPRENLPMSGDRQILGE